MTKHIELFPGSKADLEGMTGETYQALTYGNGKLMRVDTYISSDFGRGANPVLAQADVDNRLREIARENNASALVHLTYIYASGISPEPQKTRVVGGFGYLV